MNHSKLLLKILNPVREATPTHWVAPPPMYRPLGKISRGNSETLGFSDGGFFKFGTRFDENP